MNINKKVIVDAEDRHFLEERRWFDNTKGYVYTQIKGKSTYLHRLIMKAKKGQEVDHINRNKLDNRKSNLRFSNRHDQMRNAIYRIGKSGYQGVTKNYNRWTARIRINGKKTHLGSFKSPEEASMAYQKALLLQ